MRISDASHKHIVLLVGFTLKISRSSYRCSANFVSIRTSTQHSNLLHPVNGLDGSPVLFLLAVVPIDPLDKTL